MSCGSDAGAQAFCNERFAFGHARDNSTYPLFLLHPVREQGDTFTLISVRGGDAFLLNSTPEIRILPLEHFYDAFRAASMRDLHSEVISAFHLSPDKVTEDLCISRQTATELIRPDVRDLELVDEPEQGEMSPQWQSMQTPRDVRDQDTDVAMSQSSWTSSEDSSAEDSCTDEEHDQELFLEAYTAFTTKSEDAGSVESLRRWFSSVERLPDSWPLARLSITLDGLTSQLSKVVMTATMEIIASCRYPDYGLPSLTQLFFFLIAGCNGSLGYWQSLATRESNKQHQWYCVPKESQVPIHYDLSHHNLCMTERMVHKREKRHNNTRRTKARRHQPTTKTNTHNQTQNNRRHRGETWRWNGPNALSPSPPANSPITTNKWYAVIHTKACLNRWHPQSEYTTLHCKDSLCGWDSSWLPDFSSQSSLAAHGSSPPTGARKTTPRLSHSMHIGDAGEGPECSIVE